MAFKKPIYGRKKYKSNGVRVKNSYYTFSKEYPVGNIGGQRKADRAKKKKSVWLHAFIYTVCFALLITAAYFATDLGLKFSYKEPSVQQNVVSPATEDNKAQQSIFAENGIKALYMPTDKLGDTKYIKKFIRRIKSKDANSVIIDFKTQDGRLAYSSSVQLAMLGKCAMFDNETVRNAIDMFKGSKINIIAGIYCFEDPIIPTVDENLAVKYLNSDVTWLDKLEDDGGKPWLNPYSDDAQNYIKQIIEEVKQMGIDGFMLKSVSFPNSELTNTAGYPGEKSKNSRNSVLLNFIDSVKSSLGSEQYLLIGINATDALNGSDKLYFGSISKCNADGICIDTVFRPESYEIDKKTDFSAMLSLFANIKNGMNNTSKLVPMISMNEYSRRYIRTITRSGYDSFILF